MKNQPLNSVFLKLLFGRLFLPMLAITLLSIGIMAYQGGRQVSEKQIQTVNQLGETIDNYLITSSKILSSLAELVPDSSADQLKAYMDSSWKQYGHFETIYFLNNENKAELISPTDDSFLGLDFSRQQFIVSQKNTKDVNISNPDDSIRTGKPIVYLSISVEGKGKIVGELNLDELQELITQSNIVGDETTIFVTDSHGNLVAHSIPELLAQQSNIGSHELIISGAEEETSQNYFSEGDYFLGSSRRILQTDWIIAVQETQTQVYGSYLNTALIITLLAIITFVITVALFGFQISRFLVSPLTQLSASSTAITLGDFDLEASFTPAAKEITELNDLINNFTTMSRTISIREEELLESEERYRRLVDLSPEAILVHREEKIIFINPAGCSLFGTANRSEMIRKPIIEILHPEERSGGPEYLFSKDEIDPYSSSSEKRLIQIDGTPFFAEITSTPIVFEGHSSHLMIIRDISARKMIEEQLLHLATHEPLTNLPNRSLFDDRLSRSIAYAKRNHSLVGVLFVDLDNFKVINDAFSHSSGDELLKLIASRLKNSIRESDTIARVGGDEFAILVENAQDIEDISRVAQKVLDTLSKPYQLKNREVFITSSIGVSLYPKDGADNITLLRNADIAMYKAKEMGKNKFQFFSRKMDQKSSDLLTLEGYLRHALENDEFTLYYQPLIDVNSGKVEAVEALIRWNHPVQGMISPGIFIPIAESTGLILPISDWVLNQACRQQREWKDRGLNGFRMAINIAPQQLRQPDFVQSIEEALTANQLPPQSLELELSERIIFSQIDEGHDILNQIKSIGVNLSIDDFGTGYSTLRLLAHYPIDVLKIDQFYANHITTDQNDATVVSGIIKIASELGMIVVAEGIETADQVDFLKQNNCDLIQGYYFSRPLPAEEIEPFLLENL